MLVAIHAMGRNENGVAARVASTADAIEAAKRDGVLAIVPAVENGFAIGQRLSRLAASAPRRALPDADTQRPQRAGRFLQSAERSRRREGPEHGGLSPSSGGRRSPN